MDARHDRGRDRVDSAAELARGAGGTGLAPLVAVLGPTASGKSELGLAIAERFGGEIVNYDSIQFYRGFEIGSAKTPIAQRRGIPHHLIDAADPDQLVTAGEYARRARAVVAEISSRGVVPIMVGGTGLYLRALIEGLFSGPRRDERLRARLEESRRRHGAGHLHRILSRLDPIAASRIHPNDAPKLIRAIEVCLLAKAPMSSLLREGLEPLEGFKIIRLGLDPPREQLYERINLRTRRMFEQGLVEECRAMLAAGVPREARAFGSLGYKQALELLDGKIDVEQAIQSAAQGTRRYAKRQLTWFRPEPNVRRLEGFGEDPAVIATAVEHTERAIAGEADSAPGSH